MSRVAAQVDAELTRLRLSKSAPKKYRYTVETNKYRAGNEFPNRTPVFRRDTAGTGQAQGTIIPVILMQFLRDVLYRALAKPWG